MKIPRRIRQTYTLFVKCRSQGLSFKRTILVLLFKISNFIWAKYNVYASVIQLEVFDENNSKDNSNSDEETGLRVYDEAHLETMLSRIKESSKAEYLSSKYIPLAAEKKTFIWFIPHCMNIWGGGHYTLFRFINYFTQKHDINNIIHLYDYHEEAKNLKELEGELNKAFSTNRFSLITSYDQTPNCDVAIATTWQSAYFTKRQEARHKFYFMQDYESLFYPAGTQALQANYTYSFGFHGITGGPWLKKQFETYGSKAQEYIFSHDREIFYPSDEKGIVRDQVKRIFFYGRPSTPRRAYELGLEALGLISKEFPDIEIIVAGLSGLVINKFECRILGNLSLAETGDLYRTCDIGIALSATNMSYLPVELMACGCPVISNFGGQVEWYCQDKYNALLTAPTPSSILEAVKLLVKSKKLRQDLVTNGLATTAKTTWENEMEKIYQYINSICTSN